MKFATTVRLFGAATVASLLLAPTAQADSGFMIGASIGDSNVSSELGLDDEDMAYKAMFGYIFDLPAVDVGVELSYVDMGGGSADVAPGVTANADVTGVTGFGTVGVDFGLFGMFAKAGLVSWDLNVSGGGLGSFSDSGSDGAYGVGFRLNFSSIEVRAEYELFDISEADDTIDLLSLGVVWRF